MRPAQTGKIAGKISSQKRGIDRDEAVQALQVRSFLPHRVLQQVPCKRRDCQDYQGKGENGCEAAAENQNKDLMNDRGGGLDELLG